MFWLGLLALGGVFACSAIGIGLGLVIAFTACEEYYQFEVIGFGGMDK